MLFQWSNSVVKFRTHIPNRKPKIWIINFIRLTFIITDIPSCVQFFEDCRIIHKPRIFSNASRLEAN